MPPIVPPMPGLTGTWIGVAFTAIAVGGGLLWMFLNNMNSWRVKEDDRRIKYRRATNDEDIRLAPFLQSRVDQLETQLEKFRLSDKECWEEHGRKDEVNKWQQTQIEELKRSQTELIGLLKQNHPGMSDTAVHRALPKDVPPPAAVAEGPNPKSGSSGRLRVPASMRPAADAGPTPDPPAEVRFTDEPPEAV